MSKTSTLYDEMYSNCYDILDIFDDFEMWEIQAYYSEIVVAKFKRVCRILRKFGYVIPYDKMDLPLHQINVIIQYILF